MNQRALHTTPASPQSLWLTFRDHDLEQRYLAREFQSDRRRSMPAVIVAAIGVLLAYHIGDPWLLPEPLVAAFRQSRYWVQAPLITLLLILWSTLRRVQVWLACASSICVLFGMSFAWLLWMGGEPVALYMGVANLTLIQAILFLFGLPLRLTVPIVLLNCGIFLAVAMYSAGPVAATLIACCGQLTFTVTGVVSVYRVEDTARSLFLVQLRAEAEYVARLAAEADRHRWLNVMAHFLGHELRNAVISTRTSLELAQRCNTDPQIDQYLSRGHRSAAFMNELLRAAANATTLESALATQALEPIDVSQLIVGRLDDFRAAHPARPLAAKVREDLWIQGHAERWLQLMDKLLDNAIEHGRSDEPIRVECGREGNDIVLSVEDHGDELPADVDRIFDQFVSCKQGEQHTGNLGLGLFIARVIATRHHGTIVATPLYDPPGARFIVKVPCLERP